MTEQITEIDTLVVGAGQAGVAMSEHLTRLDIPHLVLEKQGIAQAWRSGRWDSLVANGPAVKLFVPAQAELQKTAEELMARGLKLRLCKNALDANKMTAADLWPGCEVVPAGLVEIVELQNKGFAYIRP